MFDIGWSELLVIGIVALIAIGPKELPGALRALGQWMAKIRRMAAEFQGQFQEAMREAEVEQLRKDMDEMAAKAKSYTQFDPLEDVRKDVERTMSDQPAATATPEVATAPPAPDTPAVAGVAEPSAATPMPSSEAAAIEPAAAPASVVPAAQPASAAPAAPEPVLAGKPDAGRAPG